MARSRTVALFLLATLALAVPALAQSPATQPAKFAWSAKDVTGQTVEVPAADRPTLIVFVMAGQPQSKEALQTLTAAAAKRPRLRLVALVSGERATVQAAEVARESGWRGAMIADTDFALANKMATRVWPTTSLVVTGGEQVMHIGGLPKSFAHDLEAYLDFASGQIDRAKLDARLAEHGAVTDSPKLASQRHVQVAHQLLDAGKLDAARHELDEARKLDAANPGITVAAAQLAILEGKAGDALTLLKTLPPDALPVWQLAQMRGRALVATGQWDAAAAELTSALRLNPDPAEAHYLLGLVYQQKGQFDKAAAEFRAAFEATAKGKHAAVPRSK